MDEEGKALKQKQQQKGAEETQGAKSKGCGEESPHLGRFHT